MAGFDRIKPPQRLAQRDGQRDAEDGTAAPTGRAAAFTSPPGAAGATSGERGGDPAGGGQAQASTGAEGTPREARIPNGPSLLHVECQHCGITAPMPLGEAVRRVLPLALVNPLRSHPLFAICPCGDRRAWLKPTLGPPR